MCLSQVLGFLVRNTLPQRGEGERVGKERVGKLGRERNRRLSVWRECRVQLRLRFRGEVFNHDSRAICFLCSVVCTLVHTYIFRCCRVHVDDIYHRLVERYASRFKGQPASSAPAEGHSEGRGGDGTEEIASAGCTMPEHYPPEPCAPFFRVFDHDGVLMETRPQLQHVLRSRDGLSFSETRAEILRTYCTELGHLPTKHEMSHHLARILSWRQSLEQTRALVRGSVERQVRDKWQQVLQEVREHTRHPGAGREQALLRAEQELAASVLAGEVQVRHLPALTRLEDWKKRAGGEGKIQRNRSASAFVERTYLQVTGQLSYPQDVFLRQYLVASLLDGSMNQSDVTRALTDTCMLSEACLRCEQLAIGAASDPAADAATDRSSDAKPAREPEPQVADHEIVMQGPCCCSGGKTRADSLASYHVALHRVGYESLESLYKLGNETQQLELRAALMGHFGPSEDGHDYMTAIGNAHLPTLSDADAPVIVLYVHNRPEYFQQVLAHLRLVEGIEQSLLIVSMDGLFSEMLALAKTIDFCRVRVLVHTARQMLHMESIVAIKQHWWWLVQQVFTVVPETKRRAGMVLFLEEDHILAPDALLVLSALSSHVLSGGCSSCWGVGLRFGCARPEPSDDTGVCMAEGFVNTGYAFNRSFFQTLDAHADDFWAFPDGWDFSIFHLIQMGFIP